MFSSNFKLSGIEDILGDIGYLSEEAEEGDEKAGEDQEHKYPKKSGKKSKDYDKDGTVEDETDEYAGVKDKAIEKAVEKEDDEDKKEKKTKKESVDFSSVLDELTDEDVLFLSDDLIEEVVEEFFYETLEEGYEIDELETLLIEQVESELTYLEEAKVTVGHDTDDEPEASRTSKLAKVKDAVKKVASGAKAVAKKVAGAAGEVAGSAVAGYKKASASAQDSSGGSSSNTTSGGSTTSSSPKATGTKRPGLLGRVAGALKSGLKKAIHGTAKAAGKVVKTAKAGYDEGRGKTATASAPAAKPVAKPAAKPVAKTATKKKGGGNLDNLLNSIRNEEVELDEAIDPKGSRRIQAAIDKNKKPETQDQKDKRLMMGKYSPDKLYKKEEIEIYDDLIEDMLSEGYDEDQIIEVIIAMEEGYEVIFEEDGAFIKDGVEQLDEEFLSDVEMVADWLHAEGVIENEGEYFELMEELSEEEIEELYELVLEATAMAKRGYDEAPIRNKIAANTKGGKSADRATALEKQPTYGNANKEKQRQNYARAQRGAHRTTASSSPGLRGYGHQSSDPAVKAKQAARGAQRGSAALTPNEKKQLNMGYEMIGDSLDNGGLEVRNYSWREVLESQDARNNPEKYEAGQKKKYAPVRGEKTPMPPRGDKRREDFEKWYAANVR